MAKRKEKPVAFELLAPYNESIALLGSWNDWQPIPMERDERGAWRVEVPLADGEYQYQFEVVSVSPFAAGKKIRVADPKAIQFALDNRRESSIARVKGGKRILTTHKWKHDDVPLPPSDQLIIYELHVGDFNPQPSDPSLTGKEQWGTFKSLIEKLDYLVELGINAIELMPVNEFPSDTVWGYSQNSIYAVENSYGTPDELCQLVDECHARGIRVLHDAVYNHMAVDAPLTQIDYNYWFYETNPDDEELQFGPKFNYEHHDENTDRWPAREHVIEAMRLWVNEFHIDGIRFDATRALKYFDLLEWFNHEVHKESEKPFYTIAEHIPQDSAVAGPDGPMDAAWHDNFYRQMIATTLGVPHEGREPFNTDEVVRLMDGRNDGFPSAHKTVHYLGNHDQERVMRLLGEVAHTFDDAAFRRSKMGAALLLTAPGVPAIWMGEEFGQAAPKTQDTQPLDWSLLEHQRNQDLHRHYAHLIQLRKTNPALYSDTYEVLMNDPNRAIIAFKRWNDEGNIVVVVANLRPDYAGDVELRHEGLDDGTWHEAIYDYDVEIHDHHLRDTLGESEVKVYIKQ